MSWASTRDVKVNAFSYKRLDYQILNDGIYCDAKKYSAFYARLYCPGWALL